MKNQAVKLMTMSVILGVMIGLATDIFIRLMEFFSKLIWSDLIPHAQGNALAVIGIMVAGGLLMGICVKYFGINKGIGFEAVAGSIKSDGELGFKQIPRVVLNAFIGLVTGASIGPEAPLITIGGYMGSLLATKLKLAKDQTLGFVTIALGGSLGVLMNTPIAGPILMAEQPPTKDPSTNRLLVFSSMVAASIGFGVYVLLKAPYLSSLKLIPAYSGFRLIHLVYALFLGVVGTGIGLFLKLCIDHLKTWFSVLNKYPILRGGLVGLLIGLAGAVFPLVLFDGSSQLETVVANVSTYSIIMLLTLGLVRLLSTAVALSGGYQGGNIFPTIFITGVVGLAISAIFPFVPAPVAMIACMVCASYVFIPLPLFTIFLFAELGGFSLIPVMAMALTTAFVLLQVQKSKTA